MLLGQMYLDSSPYDAFSISSFGTWWCPLMSSRPTWPPLVNMVSHPSVMDDHFLAKVCKNGASAKSQMSRPNLLLPRRFFIIWKLQEVCDLSQGEEWMRRKLKLHSLGLSSLECTIAHLCSRVLYLYEGDANTSFFHSVIDECHLWFLASTVVLQQLLLRSLAQGHCSHIPSTNSV
jgi:hypothetical protein